MPCPELDISVPDASTLHGLEQAKRSPALGHFSGTAARSRQEQGCSSKDRSSRPLEGHEVLEGLLHCR